jgi:hypothetical protein
MILTRIKKFIDYKGIAVATFEKSIGMSNASFGKSLKSGGSIGCDKLEKILSKYGDLNPMWLLTGQGEMLKAAGATSVPATEGAAKSAQVGAIKSNLSSQLAQLEHTIQQLSHQIELKNAEIDALKREVFLLEKIIKMHDSR